MTVEPWWRKEMQRASEHHRTAVTDANRRFTEASHRAVAEGGRLDERTHEDRTPEDSMEVETGDHGESPPFLIPAGLDTRPRPRSPAEAEPERTSWMV